VVEVGIHSRLKSGRESMRVQVSPWAKEKHKIGGLLVNRIFIMVIGLIMPLLIMLAFDDSFARSGGGSGGRGSTGGRSAATSKGSPSKGFNPYHQPFQSEVPPAQNNYINNSPYFSPNGIPFNPQNGNDKVIREPLYNYEDNFRSQY
jgi:hypothetical protein